MKPYQIVFIVGLIFGVSVIFLYASGVEITPDYTRGIIVLSLIVVTIVGLILFWKIVIKKESPTEILKVPRMKVGRVKYLAGKHLLEQHNINLFALPIDEINMDRPEFIGLIKPIAERQFPAGEENWNVRFYIHDPNHFGNREVRAVVFLDGMGNVIADPIFVPTKFADLGDLWHHPERFFTTAPSKTTKPRTLEEAVLQRMEETGEIPPEVAESLRAKYTPEIGKGGK